MCFYAFVTWVLLGTSTQHTHTHTHTHTQHTYSHTHTVTLSFKYFKCSTDTKTTTTTSRRISSCLGMRHAARGMAHYVPLVCDNDYKRRSIPHHTPTNPPIHQPTNPPIHQPINPMHHSGQRQIVSGAASQPK